MRQRRTSVGTWHVSSRLHAADVPTCACTLRARATAAGRASSRRNGQCGGAASDGRPRSPSVSSAVGGVRFGVPTRGSLGGDHPQLNTNCFANQLVCKLILSHVRVHASTFKLCAWLNRDRDRDRERHIRRERERRRTASSWSRGIEKRPHPRAGRQTCDKSPPPKKRGRRRLVRRAPRWRLTRNGRPRIPTR